MYNECDACDGDGFIHGDKCKYNETLEEDTCDCRPLKCLSCNGKGFVQEKRKKDIKFTDRKSK